MDGAWQEKALTHWNEVEQYSPHQLLGSGVHHVLPSMVQVQPWPKKWCDAYLGCQ